MNSYGGGVESAVRGRILCVWSKWRELVSLLVNYTILLEERAKFYCACVEACIAVYCRNLGTNGQTGRTVEIHVKGKMAGQDY